MPNSVAKANTLDRYMSVGDVSDGHRSQAKATALLPDLRKAFGLSETPAHSTDKALTNFAADVILGAAWYTRKYRRARWSALAFVLTNAVLVVAVPIGIAALGKYWSTDAKVTAAQYGVLVAQLSAVLSGIFALQKTLSAWYSQQQNYAGWYKCGADLKELYYSLVRKWFGHVDGRESDFIVELGQAADKSRQIMETERTDFYTRLALPSFDVLDMLTASRANATSLIAALVPASKPSSAVAIGTKVLKGSIDGNSAPFTATAEIAKTAEIASFASEVSPAVFNDVAFFSPRGLPDFDQSVVDSCAAISLGNASDITAQCCPGHSSFFDWFNATFRSEVSLKDHFPSADTAAKRARFAAFWDQIPIIFDRPQITALEFCALMAINLEESDGDLSSAAEGMRSLNRPHGGLAYAFDRIPDHKLSYNKSSENRSALSLFQDQRFVVAHRARAGSEAVLNRPGGIDPRWGGDIWPAGFPANVDTNINGFIMQADFYKFRGRGVIQTTWRKDYKLLIQYILSNEAAGNAKLSELATRWRASAAGLVGNELLEAIATISSNEDWDLAFTEDILLAKGVEIDSVNKGRYLNGLSNRADILDADNKTDGSLLNFAAHINGHDYQLRVAPMMKALICGLARTIGVSAVARAPRVPDIQNS